MAYTDTSKRDAAPAVGQGKGNLEQAFDALADQWRNDTVLLSSVDKMAMHPAYQRIIGLGPQALPLILRELQARPDHWFWALHAISGDDPVRPGATFDEAVDAWLKWGRERYMAMSPVS